MRRLVRLIRSQIRYKIILPYLSLMLLVTLAGAAIALALTAASWEERLTEQLKQIARSSSTALLQRERDHLAFLYIVALAQPNPSIDALSVPDAFASNDPAEVQRAIQPLYDYQRQFGDSLDVDRFIAFDQNGRAFFDWLRTSGDEPPASIAGTDLSTVGDVRQILSGSNEGQNDKFANLIRFSPDPQPYFYTVVPVKRGEDVVGGVLIAVKLDRMLTLFEKTSQSVVTNYYTNDGVALGSSLLRRDDELPNVSMSPETIRLLETSDSGSVYDTVDIRGTSYEFAYSPLVIADAQVGYFSVGISRDFQVETVSLSRNAVLAITLGLAIGAVLVGYYIARSITRPLESLVDTAEAVTGGDLESRAPVTSQDELGRLSLAFNQMTGHLLRLYRTSRDLNAAIEFDDVLESTNSTVRSFVDGAEVLALLDERGSWVYRLPPSATEDLDQLRSVRLSAGEPLLHELARERQPLLLSDDEPRLTLTGLTDVASFRQLLLTPLLIQESLVGVLIFAHRSPDAFTPAELPTLTAIANMASSVLYNAVLYDQVHEEASERKAILQSIADGVVVCDNQHNIVLINNSAQKMLSLPDQQLVRRNFDEVPLERVQVGQDLFGEARAGIEHYRFKNKVLALSRAPVVVDDDRLLGEVIILHDISAEAAVDEAKTDFIATISHELRTPLTPIYGNIELMLRGVFGELTADQREILELIHMRADQLKDMINNMVMVASIQSNTLATEAEPQDLSSAIENAIAPLRRSFDKKGIQLVVEQAADLPQVRADREQLRLILTQLLDNARRYTSAGSVTVRTSRQGAMVQTDIEDTGPGIPAEKVGRLFTRFHRIDGNSSPERGGGLGLSITRQLVERQGGQVWARSEAGRGSTFSFSLPIADGQIDAVLDPDTTSTAA